MKKNIKKVLLIGLMLLTLCSCGNKNTLGDVNTFAELKEKSFVIGVPDADGTRGMIEELFPNATIESYDDILIGLKAIESGKIDAFASGRNFILRDILDADIKDIKLLDENVVSFDCALGLSELTNIDNYKERVDIAVASLFADGTIDEMKQRWFEEGDTNMPLIQMPANPEYTIRAVTEGLTRPYSFVKDNTLTGFDIELAYRVASLINCDIEFSTADYPAMLMGLATGKYDMISANLYISEERQENVMFSLKTNSSDICVAIKDPNYVGENKTILNIKEGFKRTFIEENRYQMIIDGLITTLIITLFGFVLANIVGAIFCYFALSKFKVLNIINELFTQIMQGMPLVVTLMIMFYVIFGSSNISGVIISIVCFGMTSGSSLAGVFANAIKSVDKGQNEAALALGLNKRQSFIGIVMPQAIRFMLSSYFGELIGLLKGTAIVGYVAVIDLTKASNIIRSSTYDAFFPLFSIALIYFLITFVILKVLKIAQKSLEPKRYVKEEE